MSGGGGRPLKTDYDPYSKKERKRYQDSLKDMPGMQEWLEKQVEDWGNIKADANLGDRLTRSDFRDLIGGKDAEALFNFQAAQRRGRGGVSLPGGMLRPMRGLGVGLGAAGLGIGGGGLAGLASAGLGIGRGINDDRYMDQWTEGDMGYMDEQTINDITRREGFSDVAPWQEAENSGWGGDEWIRNPYSVHNKDYYEEHGGREGAIRSLGEGSHWAHQAVSQRGPEEKLDDYWAWNPDQSWYKEQGWQKTHDQLAGMTQAAQGGAEPVDEDQE